MEALAPCHQRILIHNDSKRLDKLPQTDCGNFHLKILVKLISVQPRQFIGSFTQRSQELSKRDEL